MKTFAVLVLPLAVAILASSTGVHAQGNGQAKVVVCHIPAGNPGNGQTLTLPEPAVDAHLAHGDRRGACGAGRAEAGRRGRGAQGANDGNAGRARGNRGADDGRAGRGRGARGDGRGTETRDDDDSGRGRGRGRSQQQ
jgi:hypothetical protein